METGTRDRGAGASHKHMKRILLGLPVLAGIALLTVACAKEPTEALTAARSALDAAKTAQASDYAPAALRRGGDRIRRARRRAEGAEREVLADPLVHEGVRAGDGREGRGGQGGRGRGDAARRP